jgi:hypothetical protein
MRVSILIKLEYHPHENADDTEIIGVYADPEEAKRQLLSKGIPDERGQVKKEGYPFNFIWWIEEHNVL